MAEAAGGVYVPVENGSASLERLYRDHIAAKPRREPEASAGRDLPHPFQLFVILAIVLLGAEMVMRAGDGRAGMSRIGPSARSRLCAGLLALFPSFGADQAANEAVEQGNALYATGQYAPALEKYAAAAALVPQSAEITFNQGNAWFQRHDYDKALEHYMAALTTENLQLKSSAKYNIGVIRLRQALATEQSLTEAMALTRAAIESFREGLDLDRTQSDGRYNLELALRFWDQLQKRQLERQRKVRRRARIRRCDAVRSSRTKSGTRASATAGRSPTNRGSRTASAAIRCRRTSPPTSSSSGRPMPSCRWRWARKRRRN